MSRGYTVKAAENEPVNVDASAAGAWVEVYQDGIGWLPLALTPGLEDLSAEQTESGIKPVGAGKEGNGDGPRVTEGQELEQDDAELDDSEDNTPDGGQRTGLLHKPAFWTILIAALLLLLLAAILIRHAVILKNGTKRLCRKTRPPRPPACLQTAHRCWPRWVSSAAQVPCWSFGKRQRSSLVARITPRSCTI